MTDDAKLRALAGADGPHMRRCSKCGKCLPSRKAADRHISTVHKGNGHRISARLEDRRPDYEPSLGQQVAEAMIARACGEPVDPIIADMFDV